MNPNVVKAATPKGHGNVARRASKRRGTSRYRGVCWQSTIQRWEAGVYLPNPQGGRPGRVCLGRFDRERDAAVARDRFVLGALGKKASLNFPSAGLKPATRTELLAWARRLKKKSDACRFVGVSPRDNQGSRSWRAKLQLDKGELRLGTWSTEKQAALAYDRAVLHYLGASAYLNFPEKARELVPADALTLRSEATKRRKSGSSSRYLGVTLDKRTKRWSAKVMAGYTTYNVGTFDSEKQAAQERDRACLMILGREARLNFHPVTGREAHGQRAAELGLEPRLMRRRKFVPAPQPRRPRPQTLRKGSSGYYGVVCSPNGKFAATVVPKGGKKRHVRAGTWSAAADAALARDRAALHFGLDVVLNFPKRAKALGPASPLELRKQARVATKRSAGKLPYVGVSRAWGELRGYVASIGHGGYTQSLGRFPTPKEAALCHDRAALYYHGPDAPRNFPERRLKPASIEELRREYAELRREGPDRRGVRLSNYHGVHCARSGDKWSAVVPQGDRYVRAGTWSSERQAAIARDRAVLHQRLKTELNFPKESRKLGPASPAELRLMAQNAGRKKRRLSPYIGVSRFHGRWKAQLRVDGVSQTLGYFDTPIEAAIARERALVKYKSKTNLRNLPNRRVEPASVEQLQREFVLERKRRSNTSSGYFGVSYRTDRQAPIDRPWLAQYQTGGQDPLGFWETEQQAAEAHDRALLYYGGPKRLLNFPERKAELEPTDAESLRLEARLTFFKSRTSSRFRGVAWANDRQAWLASIRHKNRVTKLGYFDSEEDAARAYDRKSIKLRGKRAWLNFHPRTGAELLGKRIALVGGRARSRGVAWSRCSRRALRCWGQSRRESLRRRG